MSKMIEFGDEILEVLDDIIVQEGFEADEYPRAVRFLLEEQGYMEPEDDEDSDEDDDESSDDDEDESDDDDESGDIAGTGEDS
jgi:hypothetical protein